MNKMLYVICLISNARSCNKRYIFWTYLHQNLNLLSKETNTGLQNAEKKIFRKLMSLNMAVWVETVGGVY